MENDGLKKKVTRFARDKKTVTRFAHDNDFFAPPPPAKNLVYLVEDLWLSHGK